MVTKENWMRSRGTKNCRRVKSMEIRKMSQSELDKAIKEELERLGGFDAWRRNRSIDEVASEPRGCDRS